MIKSAGDGTVILLTQIGNNQSETKAMLIGPTGINYTVFIYYIALQSLSFSNLRNGILRFVF